MSRWTSAASAALEFTAEDAVDGLLRPQRLRRVVGPQRRRRCRPSPSPSPASRAVPASCASSRTCFSAVFVAQGADPWIWDPIVSGDPGRPLRLRSARAAPVGAVPVRVRGGADRRLRPPAHRRGLHQRTVGRPPHLHGQEGGRPRGRVPAGTLRAAGNELRIAYTAEGSTEEDPGFAFLDVAGPRGVPGAGPTEPVPIDEISAYDSTLPAGAGAKYLIVTHAAFAEQARRDRRPEGSGGLHDLGGGRRERLRPVQPAA